MDRELWLLVVATAQAAFADRCQELNTDRFTLPKHHAPRTKREATAVDHTTHNRHPPFDTQEPRT